MGDYICGNIFEEQSLVGLGYTAEVKCLLHLVWIVPFSVSRIVPFSISVVMFVEPVNSTSMTS